MNRNSSIRAILCLDLFLTVALLSSCATFDPEKRKPVEIGSYQVATQDEKRRLLFRVDDTLPGKLLSETAWDNVSGAIWDVREAKQIGFDTDYTSAMIGGGAAFGAIGGAIAGAAAATAPDSRIVIPFGAIFEGMLRSGLSSAYPSATICSDDACMTEARNKGAPDGVVAIRVETFRVWEAPTNHLNLSATVASTVAPTDADGIPASVHQVRKELTNQSLGGEWPTSRNILRDMNRITNEFTRSIVSDLIANLETQLTVNSGAERSGNTASAPDPEHIDKKRG
jgi:hypothetical protein